MFAKYVISTKSNSPRFLGLSSLYFEVQTRKYHRKIQLEDLSKVHIEKRRKLAPLIVGGIITSLSLLSIILYYSSFEIIGLVAFGLLLTYFGVTEYTVIRLDYANVHELVWLPLSVKIDSVRPFIAILEFYVSKKAFPVLYASPVLYEDQNLVHYESSKVKARGTIIYQFGLPSVSSMPYVAVNPALLDHYIEVDGQGKVIAEGEYLINHQAIIDNNTINLS